MEAITKNRYQTLDMANFIYFCPEIVGLCWGFTAQSTQWGHVERGQFT